MPKYILVVTSSAADGRDDDYNAWYDNIHVHDLLAIPGINSAQRFVADPASPNDPPSKYLAIYEIEADDSASVMKELFERGASGGWQRTDSIDPSSARLWLWEAKGSVTPAQT